MRPLIQGRTPPGTTAWRAQQLRVAGFPPQLVERLSADRQYDILALIELAESGCPADLAARIMAPLDIEKGGP